MLKIAFKRFVLPILAIKPLQPVYRAMHRLALIGMNIGPVGEVETSGEARLAKRIIKRLPADAVIVDVGANKGEFTAMCVRHAKSSTKLFAFEPVPSIFRALQKRVQSLNSEINIQLVQQGLSDQATEATIRVTQGFEGNSSLRARPQEHLNKRGLEENVVLTTFDEFSLLRGINRVHFFKLDIEGEELACLRGAKRMIEAGAIDFLQFEFGGCNIQSRIFFKDFWDLLTPRYKIYRVLQHSVYPIPQYHELLEIFTTTNFLAVRSELSI